LPGVFHGKGPPWRGILDKFSIYVLANQIGKSHSRLYLYGSDESFCIPIEPMHVRRGDFEFDAHFGPDGAEHTLVKV